MRRKWALIGVGVLVLCVVGMLPALAQGPDQNPIYATIDYVDQQISALLDHVTQEVARLDARIDAVGGGSAGDDFDLATGDAWTFRYDEYCDAGQCWVHLNMTTDEIPAATYHGRPIPSGHLPARGRVTTADPTSEPCYAVGDGARVLFGTPSWLMQPGDQLHINLVFFWMGTEKDQQYVVNADECGPDLDPNPQHTVLDCPVNDP